MDKQFFKKLYKRIHPINIWLLLTVSVISGLICTFALRANNLQALKLRDHVLQVDKDNGDVEAALRQLRIYVADHMNTNLASGPNAIRPPIQLKYRYERALKAEQDRVSGDNAKIYNDAQVECEKQFPKGLSGSGRIPCVTNYIASHGITQKPIEDSLYKFDFVPPMWSPDLAGWTLVIASISFALFVIRFGMERWLRAELRDL